MNLRETYTLHVIERYLCNRCYDVCANQCMHCLLACWLILLKLLRLNHSHSFSLDCNTKVIVYTKMDAPYDFCCNLETHEDYYEINSFWDEISNEQLLCDVEQTERLLLSENFGKFIYKQYRNCVKQLILLISFHSVLHSWQSCVVC